jgi:hypothetical protein
LPVIYLFEFALIVLSAWIARRWTDRVTTAECDKKETGNGRADMGVLVY